MKGKFYIDGEDAFVKYGVFVADNGYTNLISYPAFKDLDKNIWPEENGIEVDLTEPVLDYQEIQLSFFGTDYWMVIDFIAVMSDKSYHEFDFKEINRKVKLRLVTNPKKEIGKSIDSFTLTFANDFPMEGYEYVEPATVEMPKQLSYEIDGVPLSNYGVFLLNGSDAEILKTPAVKKNLLVDLSNKSGATYDGEIVVFQQKDIPLKCWMRCDSTETMWRNLDALVYDLIKLSEKEDEDGFKYDDAKRSFYVENLEEEYPCYYNGLKATRFQILPDGRVWLEFTLTLSFTSFVVGEVEYLLSSEAEELIITEDGEYCIDMKYYGD